MPQLRFASTDAYISDIKKIRDDIKANGSLAQGGNITLVHPNDANINLTFVMNFALQPNGSFASPNGSLYIVAITNGNGTYPFNMNPFPIPAIPGAAAAMPDDGSYASLNYNNDATQITSINLAQAIQDVSGYAGGATSAQVKRGLARLIIATAEAARFSSVATGISQTLKGTPYVPEWDSIHNWDAKTLGHN